MKFNIKYLLKVLTLSSIMLMVSCDTDLDINPSNQVSDKLAYETLDAADAALAGVYDSFTFGWYAHYTNQYLFYVPDIMGEDVYVSSVGNYNRFLSTYQYSVDPTSTYTEDPWAGFYTIIDNANALIEGLGPLPDGNLKDQILGQALAIRAYSYHFLVRLYAKPYSQDPNAPGLVIRTVSSIAPTPRTSVKDVYSLMVNDLTQAIELLDEGTDKLHIDKRAAQGMLARVYLDMGDDKAITNAEAAAKGIELLSATDYATENFCKVNSETLWAYSCTLDDRQSFLSIPSFYYYADGGEYNSSGTLVYQNVLSGYSSLRVSKNLIDLFDDADVRKKQFPVIKNPLSGSTDPYLRLRGGILTSKMRHVGLQMGVGAINYLRASEMYLIIAEIAADKGDYAKARNAINTLRKPRGLGNFAGADNTLVDEIQLERRRELFAEGHRVFDIKRRKQPLSRYTTYDSANPSSNAMEGHWNPVYISAGSNKFQIPIPKIEMDANKALSAADQNPTDK